MYAGVVSGSVVATVKDSGLEGVPLLIVRKIENGKEAGLIIAADHTRQAGLGDYVYLAPRRPPGSSGAFGSRRTPRSLASLTPITRNFDFFSGRFPSRKEGFRGQAGSIAEQKSPACPRRVSKLRYTP